MIIDAKCDKCEKTFDRNYMEEVIIDNQVLFLFCRPCYHEWNALNNTIFYSWLMAPLKENKK